MSVMSVIVEETHTTTLENGTLGGGILESTTVTKQLDTRKLRTSLSDLSSQVSEILQDIKTVGEFKLKDVKLSVKISSEGDISLRRIYALAPHMPSLRG